MAKSFTQEERLNLNYGYTGCFEYLLRYNHTR